MNGRIKFSQVVGGLAKIEGTAVAGEAGIQLELAMTESIKGPVKGVLKRQINYVELQDITYTKRLFKPSVLIFTAAGLEAFSSLPGAQGFVYAVNPENSKADCRSFVSDVQLAIAQATMDHFTQRIEQSRSGK